MVHLYRIEIKYPPILTGPGRIGTTPGKTGRNRPAPFFAADPFPVTGPYGIFPGQ